MPSTARFAACFALLLALPWPAGADDYVGYRRIGAWNLARKTSPAGKRLEMMAVAAKETQGDFFLVMCALKQPALYVSIVTKDASLAQEEKLRLTAGYAFGASNAEFEMQKVTVDDEVVLRDDAKADVEAITAALAKSQLMSITVGGFKRSYDLTGFADAFSVVDGACRANVAQ